jgi:hypothetical protein
MAPESERFDHRRDPSMARQVAHTTELNRMVEARDSDGHQTPADTVGPLEECDAPIGPSPLHCVGHGRPGRSGANDCQVEVDSVSRHCAENSQSAATTRARLEIAIGD